MEKWDIENHYDKEFMLNSLTALVISNYSCSSIFKEFPDTSLYIRELCKALKDQGVTIEEVDKSLKHNDFTGQLLPYGSGNRERGFVIEALKEYWK